MELFVGVGSNHWIGGGVKEERQYSRRQQPCWGSATSSGRRQKVRVAIGVDGVRVRRDVDAGSRSVPVFEVPSDDPGEQRDMVRLVVCDREVGKPALIEIRDGQVHRLPRRPEAPTPLLPNAPLMPAAPSAGA